MQQQFTALVRPRGRRRRGRPLNQGKLVLGGGREQADLYTGSFQTDGEGVPDIADSGKESYTRPVDEIAIVQVPPTSPRGMARRGFAINGRPLGDLVVLGNLVCVLDTADRAVTRRVARELRGAAPSDLASGRVPLYVCAECGDLGCGAVTVRVTELDDCFVWSELSIESYSSATPITWRVRDERDFYFAREHYLATIY